MRRIGNFAVRTVDYVFIGLLSIIMLSAIVSFSELISGGWIKYVIIIVSLAIVVWFAFFGGKILQKLYVIKNAIENCSAIKLGIILFLVVLLTKVFFVFLFDNDADKTIDMHLYKSFATQLANEGKITENIVPALQHSYQVIYGLFLSPVVKLFGNDSKVLTSFLSFLFSIVSVLLYDILKRYVGKNKAFTGLLLFNLLPVGLFETQLLVHETALLFFYITSFWLLTKCLDNRFNVVLRLFSVLLSAVLIAFGNKINQGGTIVIISYCFYVIIILLKDKLSARKLLKCLYSIACYGICFVVISSACSAFVNNHVVVKEEDKAMIERSVSYRAVPFGWPAYLGMNLEHAGHWNEQDAKTYDKYKEFDNKEDAQNYIRGLVNGRLQVFKENPLLIPGHLFNKIKGLWGEPFLPFAYEEGNSINDFVLKGARGMIYKGILIVSYWVFILLCSLILFSHRRHKNVNINDFYTPVTQFKMMVIGITAVLFLFEVMPKYVSHMQIILFCIGIFSIDSFISNSYRFNKRLKKDN